MGHHGKTTQEDTDHKDSEAPALKNWIQEYYNASFDFGVVDKVKVPDLPEGKYVLSWRWEPWISKFGRFSWEFCDSFRQTLLWMENLQVFLNGLGNIFSHLVKFLPTFFDIFQRGL